MAIMLFILHFLTVENAQKFSITSSLVKFADWRVVHTVFSFARSNENFHLRFFKLQVLQWKEMIKIS